VTIYTRARGGARARRAIQLTTKEYTLLEYLARRQGEVVGRADIAEHVWDDSFDPLSNLIEVYIQRLRRKIDDGHAVKLLHTRRGAGYTLQAADDESPED
jgi:two-component system copper resistance phosphate regulon response regulator CusR